MNKILSIKKLCVILSMTIFMIVIMMICSSDFSKSSSFQKKESDSFISLSKLSTSSLYGSNHFEIPFTSFSIRTHNSFTSFFSLAEISGRDNGILYFIKYRFNKLSNKRDFYGREIYLLFCQLIL
jgi:hypothetical protein